MPHSAGILVYSYAIFFVAMAPKRDKSVAVGAKTTPAADSRSLEDLKRDLGIPTFPAVKNSSPSFLIILLFQTLY